MTVCAISVYKILWIATQVNSLPVANDSISFASKYLGGDKMTHSEFLVNFINEHQIERFIEIGVYKCKNAIFLLKNTSCIKEYWAVDPWMLMGPEDGRMGRGTQEGWDSGYYYACQLMLEYPQLRVVRAESLAIAPYLPDGYFDFVYIDALHTYEGVQADIKAWTPKVAKGKYIGGDDYNAARKKHKIVTIAVNDAFKDEKIQLGRGKTWYVHLV